MLNILLRHGNLVPNYFIGALKRRHNRVLRTHVLAVIYGLILMGCSDSSSPPATRDVHTTRCVGEVSAFDRHEFQCDGVKFNVMLTQECIDQACGLIFDLHGWLSNPEQQEARSNLARAALENGGYIVVQPGELSQPSSWKPEIHNAIVYEFMQQALEAFDVDRDLVHFTGFSQGGLMTWQFICDHSDVIASAAPVSSIAIDCLPNKIGPDRMVPTLLISGTQDILVRYYNPVVQLSVPYTLVAAMYDYGMVTVDADGYNFSETGGIVVDGAGKIDVASDTVRFEVVDGNEDAGYFWTRYTNANDIVFEHLRHTNGHVYPDNPDSLIFPEEPSVWFSIGDAILQFFIENPRT